MLENSHLRIQKAWYSHLLFSNLVSQLIVLEYVLTFEAAVVDEVGSEVMDHGTEGETVPPAGVHVYDVHILIARCHSSTPDLETKRLIKFKIAKDTNFGAMSKS